MKLPAQIAIVASGLLLTACSTFGIRSGTEEPAYTVVETIAAADGGAAEIRRYGARLAAEVVVPGDEQEARSAGFRTLAAYIFGENEAKADIAMTAPGGAGAGIGHQGRDHRHDRARCAGARRR